jgi:hypothetical protein
MKVVTSILVIAAAEEIGDCPNTTAEGNAGVAGRFLRGRCKVTSLGQPELMREEV